MPIARHPLLQNFLTQCIFNELTAKQAYKQYEDEGIPEQIGSKRVTLGRFSNIYYGERQKLKGTPALDRATLLQKEMRNDPFGYLPLITELPKKIADHPAIKDSIFSIEPGGGKEIYIAWRELVNTYTTYRLDVFSNADSKYYDENSLRIHPGLVKWYVRVRNLISDVNSLTDVETQRRIRMLCVLAAEHLTFWETIELSGLMKVSRPIVESIFYTEFWKWPPEDFDDITLEIGARNSSINFEKADDLSNSRLAVSTTALYNEVWNLVPKGGKDPIANYNVFEERLVNSPFIAAPNNTPLVIEVPLDQTEEEFLSSLTPPMMHIKIPTSYLQILKTRRTPLTYFLHNYKSLLHGNKEYLSLLRGRPLGTDYEIDPAITHPSHLTDGALLKIWSSKIMHETFTGPDEGSDNNADSAYSNRTQNFQAFVAKKLSR